MTAMEDLSEPDLAGGRDLAPVRDLRAPEDLSILDLAVADLSVPDLAIPDLAAPDLTMADMLMADLSTPPDMRAPDMRAPDMRAPDMRMPDMRAPDMRAPDMRTPDMTMPVDLSRPPDMAACTSPTDCGGTTPYCCADITVGPGSPPMCPVTSVSVACTGTCNGNIPFMCDSMDRARLCNKGADCAGDPGGYKNCCQFMTGMLSVNVCITDILKLFAGPCIP